jgi:hypothetical protein
MNDLIGLLLTVAWIYLSLAIGSRLIFRLWEWVESKFGI